MHLPGLLDRRSSCIDTSSCPPASICSCPSNQQCVLINVSCTSCAFYECQSLQTSTSSGGGVSTGAVAGAVVGSLVFLALVFGLYLWYRRSPRFRSAPAALPEVKDVPAPASDVLNRPDPMEKHYSNVSVPPTEMNTVRVYSSTSNSTIDLDPQSRISPGTTRQTSVRSNPFEDNHSIQTTGTEGTNVIPIALVTPESQSPSTEDVVSRSSSPLRPLRSPDLNLDHINVSHDSLKDQSGKGYPNSTISGISRNSYMSSASYSSEILNEAPMIMTPTKGAVRQVLGVVKAEMVNAPSHSPTSSEGLKPNASKPVVRSPLAASSFVPSDLNSIAETASLSEEGGIANGNGNGNPFSDRHSTRTTLASSPAASHTTFGEASPDPTSRSDWTPTGPGLPWVRSDDDSRPSSISTQAGSVIDIANATRVNLGLSQLSSDAGAQTPRSPYRTTMGRLVTPPTSALSDFEHQQQIAIAHAQAQARAQGGGHGRKTSASSAMSGTSTRADSILESFPFVPPSPISNRPARSPPLSPLAQQTFKVSPPSPMSVENFPATSQDISRLRSDSDFTPPNRKTLGLSTGSQLSTASTGLGSFPFQIDTGSSRDSSAPSAFNGRQRASLDTLAITSDLSSFPLGFDRDSVTVPLPRRND
ncbi:hypothetical protein BDP27DRAFT_1211833 [Rhodocollybia butyracea]|uniref:Membrane anchor Opy2 N-terminal domain-containing protein n=1 Tax=Rhodocollybia butyracea TaxID=206335 RepID=A0A9P5Q6S3_9AGAR|nr:hypothetical protein BDP27DRAFT_1211833 [Rhodocollybia butyracea]